jgi:hypothetical protein
VASDYFGTSTPTVRPPFILVLPVNAEPQFLQVRSVRVRRPSLWVSISAPQFGQNAVGFHNPIFVPFWSTAHATMLPQR